MSIRLEQLTKRYEGRAVVSNVSLEVATGELCVLLGPSGSGKSTILRLVAGLAPCDGGRILLDGVDLAPVPARERGLGFVFQSYALFRHQTVAENVEFALRVRGESAAARRSRREELLELVGLSGLGQRLPTQLSGGQQQRVALARALAHRPRVLLLDEPFGALDARIRLELRRSLSRIQRELAVTTLFVTHDQEEAFELADRLAVMSQGRLVEDGPPRELYLRPQTEFAATFLGGANLLVGRSDEHGIRIGAVEVPLKGSVAHEGGERRVQLLVRPEDVEVAEPGSGIGSTPLGEGTVEEVSFIGAQERLRLKLPTPPGVRVIHPPRRFGDPDLPIEAVRSQHDARRFRLAPGDRVRVGIRRFHALLHPGLSLLLAEAEDAPGVAAGHAAAEIARLAQARLSRTTLEAVLDRRGEIDRAEAPDLLVAGAGAGSVAALCERLLAATSASLLLVRDATPIPPARFLIAVAVGEPGKEDVAFAGRLARHLGAGATVVSVLDAGASAKERTAAERFLSACVRTLAALGVPAAPEVLLGEPGPQLAERIAKTSDVLVLGAPPPDAEGEFAWSRPLRTLLDARGSEPILVVRAARGQGLDPAGDFA
jgi:sulfate transport system ATP-binding protein